MRGLVARRAALLLFVALAWAPPPPAQAADSLEQVFARGNRAYSQGDYARAIEHYTILIEAGVEDPAVTFNLGSAHASLGRYGEAIRYFERTLRLAPSDEGAQRNLQNARTALAERLAQESGEALLAERPPLVEALFARVRAESLAYALLFSAWLASACGLLLGRTRTESKRLALGITCALSTLLALVSGFGLGVSSDWGRSLARAVVIAPSAVVRDGPDVASPRRGELLEGSLTRVLAYEGAFAHVKSGDLEGFVLASEVGEI